METAELEIGCSLNRGRYTVERYLGSGSVKTVYAARDEMLQRRVAVALVDVSSSRRGEVSADVWEAQVLGALGTHPNIVTIFDRWTEDDRGYIVSELLIGGDLSQRARDARAADGCVPMTDVVRWANEICDGLMHVHTRDVVHLDVQPATSSSTTD